LQEQGTTVDEEDHEKLDRDIEEDIIVQHEILVEPTIRIFRVPSSEADKVLVEKIIDERSRLTNGRPRLSALRHIEKVKLLQAVRQINEVLDCVEINNITELNDTIIVCAIIVTKQVCNNKERRKPNNVSAWKVRLQKKSRKIRSDLSKVVVQKKTLQ